VTAGGVGFPTTTTPFSILNPTLPTYPPTLPLTLWGVVHCTALHCTDAMHARPSLWLGPGVCVAVGRRACHPAGKVDGQSIAAS
jgi:hypothetical protein